MQHFPVNCHVVYMNDLTQLKKNLTYIDYNVNKFQFRELNPSTLRVNHNRE